MWIPGTVSMCNVQWIAVPLREKPSYRLPAREGTRVPVPQRNRGRGGPSDRGRGHRSQRPPGNIFSFCILHSTLVLLSWCFLPSSFLPHLLISLSCPSFFFPLVLLLRLYCSFLLTYYLLTGSFLYSLVPLLPLLSFYSLPPLSHTSFLSFLSCSSTLPLLFLIPPSSPSSSSLSLTTYLLSLLIHINYYQSDNWQVYRPDRKDPPYTIIRTGR